MSTKQSPVSVHYDNDTKTNFADLADALFHVAQQGLAGVVEVREMDPGPVVCEKCGGTGVADYNAGQQIMSRKQLEKQLAQIQEQSDGSVDGNLKAARQAAKEGSNG